MPETKDIVTRLRTWPQNNPCYLMEDAAGEIETLRDRITALECRLIQGACSLGISDILGDTTVKCTCGDTLRVPVRDNIANVVTVKPCLNCTSAAWDDGFENRKRNEEK